MKKREIVLSLFIVMLSNIPQILMLNRQSMIMPPALKRIMARVNSMKSFKKLMKIRNVEDVIRSGLVRSGQFGTSVELENQECKPHPVVVPVPQPEHNSGFTFPFFVKLHRCAGSCNTKPRISRCFVQVNSTVKLRTYQVTWRYGVYRSDTVDVRMINHTRCQCRCNTRPSDCDSETQVWEEDNCRCLCKPRNKSCPKYHVWDPIYCKCRCNVSSPQPCWRRMEWDQDKCQCVCKKRKCRHGKRRNSKCRCLCPKRRCPTGQTLNSKSCKCINNLFRVSLHEKYN